jgi:hypothetical protein
MAKEPTNRSILLPTERTTEEWRNYIREPIIKGIENFIEAGKRIKEFHDYYLSDLKKWGERTWDEVCKDDIGITRVMCSYYETLARVFTPEVFVDIQHDLPPYVYSLYQIARTYEINPSTVESAIENKIIHPEMTQEEAGKLPDAAKLSIISKIGELLDNGYDEKELLEGEENPVRRKIKEQAIIEYNKTRKSFKEVKLELEKFQDIPKDRKDLVIQFALNSFPLYEAIIEWDKKYGHKEFMVILEQLIRKP